MKPQVIVLSGGSEIVATALVEELLANGIQPAVIALRADSILQDLNHCFIFHEITEMPQQPVETAKKIIELCHMWEVTFPIPVLATEDGGLRLLFEQRALFESYCVFGRARALKLGGLDKAELFAFLSQKGLSTHIAPTAIAATVEEALAHCTLFHEDAVIKPALKPLSMELTGMSAKTVSSRDYQNREELSKTLHSIWKLAESWVVQARLTTPPEGEMVIWAIRDNTGQCYCMAAAEVWKQPKQGGTGCWVRTLSDLPQELFDKANDILNVLDFIGICELEFLLDAENSWCLLELNPRPWLQIGLAWHSGVPLATTTVQILTGKPLPLLSSPKMSNWVNVERMLLAALSGEQGIRIFAIWKALLTIIRANNRAIYDSKLPHVRVRWVKRMLRMSIIRLFSRHV